MIVNAYRVAKIVQGECRTPSLLERYAEPQPISCKVRKKMAYAQTYTPPFLPVTSKSGFSIHFAS